MLYENLASGMFFGTDDATSVLCFTYTGIPDARNDGQTALGMPVAASVSEAASWGLDCKHLSSVCRNVCF